MADKKLISREEVLGGMGGRLTKQASTLLSLIENRTAFLIEESQQITTMFLTERSAQQRHQAFLEAIALDRELPIQPTIQDLEYYGPRWAALVPDNPRVRAMVVHLLAQKYAFTYQATPRLRAALGLDDDVVQQAYQTLHHEPLESIFATQTRLSDRLRWYWTAVIQWPEALSPFWATFAMIVGLSLSPAVLGLPIAVAKLGPLVGVVLVIIIGFINVLTMAYMAESITRSGAFRYGRAFLGPFVANYLGSSSSTFLSLALMVRTFLAVLASSFGIVITLTNSTPVPTEVWVILLIFILFLLLRKSLKFSVTILVLLAALTFVFLLPLTFLAFTHIKLANLTYTSPSFQENPFDPSNLQLVFGVIFLLYFGHIFTIHSAKVVLPRDPSGRSLIWGSIAGTACLTVFFSIWMLAMNGAIDPQALADHKGTVIIPLAEQIGGSVYLLGSILVVLLLGLSCLRSSSVLFKLVQERLPTRPESKAMLAAGLNTETQWVGEIVLSKQGRFFLSISPAIAALLLTEWFVTTGTASFSQVMSISGVIVNSMAAGIFPVLLLIASRRKGELRSGIAYRFLGHPVLLTTIYLLFLTIIFLHGLVIWQNPVEQAGALIAGTLIVGITIIIFRQGVFNRRLIVELREDQSKDKQSTFAVTVGGQPVTTEVQLGYANDEQQLQATTGEIPTFASLRYAKFELPANAARELKVWGHKITPEGISVGLSALVEVQCGNGKQGFDLKPAKDQVMLPINGEVCQVEITLIEQPAVDLLVD